MIPFREPAAGVSRQDSLSWNGFVRMQGESVRRVVEPFPHVTGAWISRQRDFVFCITRGCVIGGSYFRFGDGCLC